MRFEKKNELELEADRILAEDTKKRRSGLTAYAAHPANESLTLDDSDWREELGEWDEYPSDFGVTYEDNLRSRALNNRVAALLTDRQLDCVNAVVVGGLSYGEAGKLLKISKGTVHDHVQTALRKIKDSLSGDALMDILFPELGLLDQEDEV